MNTNNSATATSTHTIRRGLKKKEVINMLKDFTFSDQPFTLKQAITSFGVDHWLVVDYVKKNATIVGDAPKDKGANGKSRGPAAKLYQLPADKVTYQG